MSIEYDDNDLIFVSGGKDDSKFNCNDIFLILKFSSEGVEFRGALPSRRMNHSTIYSDNTLYLIGGIT